jgi:hypothetical protein
MLDVGGIAGGERLKMAGDLPRKAPESAQREAGIALPVDEEAAAVLLPNDHRRGLRDTAWDPGRKRTSGRFWKMLSASLLVHAFLTPGPALLGLISLLPALDLGPQEELVEVDLTALPMGAVAPEPAERDLPAGIDRTCTRTAPREGTRSPGASRNREGTGASGAVSGASP